MKFILRYLKPYYKRMSVGLSIKMFATLLELTLPAILGHILNSVLVPEKNKSLDVRSIAMWGVLMLSLVAIVFICDMKANRMASRVARDASESIRHDLFARIVNLSGRQVDAFTIPSLEARITSDTYNVHHFIGVVQRLGVRAPMLLLGGVCVTIVIDASLSLIMIAMLPFIFFVTYFVMSRGVPLYKQIQKSVDGMVRVVREDSQGIRVIKALSKIDREHERYDKVNRVLIHDEKKASLTMGVVGPAMNLFMNLGITFVVVLGAYRVDGGTSLPGNIVSFTQYFTRISMAMLNVTRIIIMFTKSSASAHRIQEVVDTEKDLEVASFEDYPIVNDDGYIVFDNVNFSYNGSKDNLKDISFSVPHGGTLGIIGSTGSGKTTIVSLLMRFYDVNSGSIRIGGQDVRTIEEERLHTMFGVAFQNDFLYSDSIEENIKFGRDISHEDVVRAAKIAQADEFIMAFEDSYDHVLSQKGTNVSGGQKQRILISRAIAGKPDILVLDDSSSALDYKTDANLRRAISSNMKGTTSVIVAQRVSSIMHSDVIVVLEDGEIVGYGTHDELMSSCEIYREISDSQMGGAFGE